MLKFMKSKIPALCLALFALSLPLGAEEAIEEKVIPTEVSEPPYEIGNLVTQQGHYIELEDGLSINFRIVGNKVRIYWIDADGLIAEPQSSAGTVRFMGSVRGQAYHRVALLSDDAGLGAPGLVLTPHIFNVILNLEQAEGEALDNYTFRYVPAMDRPVDDAEPKGSARY
jgi:hypothetical protein